MNKNIYCTGLSGFLGSHLLNQLIQKSYNVIIPEKRLDLIDKMEVISFFAQHKIDVVIACANVCGGIEFNQNHQADIFYQNVLMNLNLIDVCNTFDVKKFVAIGSICEYGHECPTPFKEENVFEGIPTKSNRSYGFSKRMMYEQCLAYHTQYDFNFIHPLLINLFGEKDCFDDSRSHVISALIKKVHKAKVNKESIITIWGDGSAYRSFLYVKDAADCIIHLMENYNSIEPINVGMDFTISIKELAEMICELMNYKGEIVWDVSKPNGQMKRQLDTTKLKQTGWEPKYSFKEGLINTIKFFEDTYSE